MDAIREYHASVFSNVEINNCKVVAPPKLWLNKNSISEIQSAILKAFKESNDDKNPYVMVNKHYKKDLLLQELKWQLPHFCFVLSFPKDYTKIHYQLGFVPS